MFGPGDTIKFESTKTEREAAEAFMHTHNRGCPESKSATGEKYTLYITPGGLGYLLTIKCLMCKLSECITDFDTW